MTEENKVCAGCDYVIDTIDCHYTPAGAGPFCSDCWESLNDPDQMLLLEKRLSV